MKLPDPQMESLEKRTFSIQDVLKLIFFTC